MNIIIYLHNLQINGSNLAIYRYIRQILKKNAFGFAVSSTSDGPMAKIFKSSGVKVYIEIPNHVSLSKYSFSIINSLIRYDALKLLSDFGFPFIQFVHENWGPEDFIGGVNVKWNWYLQPWEEQKKMLLKAKKLIFPAAYLEKKYDEFPSVVIYNPVDKSDLSEIYFDMHYPADGIGIVNIGTINARKNQSVIVDVCSRFPSIESCRFFGDRNIRDYEVEYSVSLKESAEKVKHCAFEFNSVAYPLRFDVRPNTIFLLTSIEEVLPCTIQEMMSVGVPVVAPNRFGIPEVISDGITGVLFESYDEKSIVSALEHAKENSSIISSNSIACASELFDPEIQADKLISEFI